MASYQVGSACYPTASAAASASASSMAGAVLSKGTTLQQVDVVSVTDTSITYKFTSQETGIVLAVTQTFPYTAQPCGLMGVDDAVQLGWLVGAAWVVAYAVKFIGRTVRNMINREDAQDGNP